MMRKWLQTLVNEYLPAVAELQHTAVDQAQASEWATWIRQQWAKHGMADLKQQRKARNPLYPTFDPNTVQKYLCLSQQKS